MDSFEFIECPLPECTQIAEVSDRFEIPDSQGHPVVHLTVWCLLGHHFTYAPEDQ